MIPDSILVQSRIMLGRMVEIADDLSHLSLQRGFMVVEETTQKHDSTARELGGVPLDDLAALIVHANGVTYTNNVLAALEQHDAPFAALAKQVRSSEPYKKEDQPTHIY